MNDQLIQKRKKTFVRRVLKSDYFWCVLGGLCWCSVLVIDFVGGYRGFHVCLSLFPAAMFPALLAVIITLTFMIRACRSVISGRRLVLLIALILVGVAWWLIPQLSKQSAFLLGFKCRVLRDSSPQELREIAAKARILLTEEKDLPGPGKRSFWEEDVHRELWEKMSGYEILGLAYSHVVISVSDSNCVELWWGGALTGHWGIRIAEKTVEASEHDWNYSQIEEDIAVYMCDY